MKVKKRNTTEEGKEGGDKVAVTDKETRSREKGRRDKNVFYKFHNTYRVPSQRSILTLQSSSISCNWKL
ncbi:hypothetical protein S245_004788 [Arachis hypogaea]